MHQGQLDEAIVHFRTAVKADPFYANALFGLATALVQRGAFDEAIACVQKAMKIKPNAQGRQILAVANAKRDKFLDLLAGQRTLLSSRPDDVALLNDVAWTLATNPNASIRNGTEAVDLAQHATVSPAANIRRSSARWPPPMPKQAASATPYKPRRRPLTWRFAKTKRRWPIPYGRGSSSIKPTSRAAYCRHRRTDFSPF